MARDQLKAERDQVANEYQQLNHKQLATVKERDALIAKNEHAKQKVEAIIQRLAVLGTAQDQNAQEIQQLAHPNAEIHEET